MQEVNLDNLQNLLNSSIFNVVAKLSNQYMYILFSD